MKFIDHIPGYRTDLPLKRRVNDEAYQSFNAQELDKRQELFVKANQIQTKLDLRNGFLDASVYTTVIQDSKFWIDVLTERVNAVDAALSTSFKNTKQELKSVFNAIDCIKNSLDSIEISTQEGWTQVVINSFNNSLDKGLGASDYRWRNDWKTGRVFQDVDLITPIPHIGLALPVIGESKIFVKNIQFVSENTSVGDSIVLDQTDANELLSGKPITYSVLKIDKDTSRQVSNYQSLRFTLLFEFGGREVLNNISLVPAAFSPLEIESIKYLNEIGDLTDVPQLNDVDTSFNFNFVFSNICTTQIEIVFSVSNATAYGAYTLGERNLIELNKLLEGYGFKSRYHVDTRDVVGALFTFGINDISFKKLIFGNAGLFRASAIEVKSLKSIGCDQSLIQYRAYNTEDNAYDAYLPEDSHWIEHYLACELEDSLGIVSNEFFPIPNNAGNQMEIVPIENDVGRLKLVPDLFWKQVLNNVVSATYTEQRGPTTIGYWIVKTEFPHNFVFGDTPKFLGREDIDIPNDLVVTQVVSTTEFKIMVRTSSTDMTDGLLAGHLPQLKVYTYNNEFGVDVRGSDLGELELGTDFEISLDAGRSWLSDIPSCQRFEQRYSRAKAGDCYIRIRNGLQYNNIHVFYQPQNIQQLDSRGIFWYKNNKIILSKPLTGKIYPIFIFRNREFLGGSEEIDYYNKYIIKLRETDVL